MKSFAKFFLFLACLFTGMIMFSSSSFDDTEYAKLVEETMARYKCPGLSVVVVKDNNIFYHRNFGYKDVEAGIPLDDSTIFRIASISKSFTATGIMQQVEQGKVSLKDDASDLLGFKIRNPKFPDTVITLEMLLSHRSSISDIQGYYSLDRINPAVNPDWEKCYGDYEPGTKNRYCNLNYTISGTILERVSGERFDQYIVNHILKPLGVYGGYCVDSLDASRFAKLYEIKNDKPVEQIKAYEPRSEEIRNYRFGYDAALFSPTGGLKISALDLAKVMIMHINYGYSPLANVRIISEESSKDMQTNRSERGFYGLAISKEEMLPGVVLTGHTGNAHGLRSAMYFDPEKKLGIVVISNGSQTPEGEDRGVHTRTVINTYSYFFGK